MKENKVRKLRVLLLAVGFSIFCSSCGQVQDINKEAEEKESSANNQISKDDADIIKVYLDQKFLNISGKSVEETVAEIRDGGNCLDIYENEDGTITVEINRKQQEYWVTSRGELLEELQRKFKEYDKNYRLEHNDSYTQVDAYYNQELPWDKAGIFVVYAEWLCASYQLFNETDSNNWEVAINIYNSDTGKLVKCGSSDASLTYDNSDWEASK